MMAGGLDGAGGLVEIQRAGQSFLPISCLPIPVGPALIGNGRGGEIHELVTEDRASRRLVVAGWLWIG
jgi:hypothetical protein